MIFIEGTHPINRKIASGWLLLALTAIGLSALFALLLVVSRTPGLQNFTAISILFRPALVLHVNFSVVIWLLAFTAALWSLALKERRTYWDGSALILSACGTLLMAAAPLFGGATPVMNNYIPVLANTAFLSGLSLFASGLTLLALRLIIERRRYSDRHSLPHLLLSGSAITYLAALLAILLTALKLPMLESAAYFESLFWGGGHILQFVHTLILIYAWLLLAENRIETPRAHPLHRIVLLPAVVGLLIATAFDPLAGESRSLFTHLMRWGGLLILLPTLGWLLYQQFRHRLWRLHPLSLSITLMLLGLIIGLLIRNDTVIVTAHYHATNAAVTLAFIGLAYRMLPLLNLLQPGRRQIQIQATFYASGMTLYIIGMAWSGWLGIPRKSSDSLGDTFGSSAHYAMGLMGTGGLIAIAATILFLYILITTHHRSDKPSPSHHRTRNAL